MALLLVVLALAVIALAWRCSRRRGQSREERLLQCWDELISLRSCGDISFRGSDGAHRIVIVDPGAVRELLADDAHFFCKASFVRVLEILEDGLFGSCGERWSKQRQLLQPAFLHKKIKDKVELMMERATAAANTLVAEEVDIHNFFLCLTLDILNSTTFGSREISANSLRIVSALARYHRRRREQLFSYRYKIPGYRYLSELFSPDASYLTCLMDKVIKQQSSEQQPNLLVSKLLKANEDNLLSHKELRDNCMTLLTAGHETTASLLTWTFCLLGRHQGWQQQARAEVTELVSEQQISWALLTKLKLLSCILMEALRLYPPQPLLGRDCVRETKLGERRIHAGLEAVVPTAALHRDEELWGMDAAEFRPSRFSDGIKGACSNPSVYLPFGGGPRTCIGQAFALAEAKVVLAIFLRRFSWEVSSKYRHQPDMTLVLQPKFGMPLVLTPLC